MSRVPSEQFGYRAIDVILFWVVLSVVAVAVGAAVGAILWRMFH